MSSLPDRFLGPLRRLVHWLGQRELPVLLGLLLVAAGSWGFIELADEVLEGETGSVDERILLAFRGTDRDDPLGPRWVEEIMRDLTALGGWAVLSLLVVGTAGYLLLMHKSHAASLFVLVVSSGAILSQLLKAGFDRPRPDLVVHGSHVYTKSFPSGHSMLSALIFLTVATMLIRVQGRTSLKVYILLIAVLVTLAVGVSRVYLGVHWPSDVLAGWTLGGVWAVFCWIVTRALQRRGQVEAEEPAAD